MALQLDLCIHSGAQAVVGNFQKGGWGCKLPAFECRLRGSLEFDKLRGCCKGVSTKRRHCAAEHEADCC